jgi:adhesin transport system membrane fusion protein
MSQVLLEDLTDRIKPKAASNLLLWGIVAFVVIFIAWASLTTLEGSIVGSGRVVPSSQLQVVSNPEGGVVEEILVQTGQSVEAGQELIRLDPTATSAEFGSGEASFSALRIKIARLEAEVAGRRPVFPPAGDAAAAEQIGIEQALYGSRTADLASILSAAQARLNQAERAVAEAQAAYEARRAASDGRANEVQVLRRLVDRGIEPRISLSQAESAAAVSRSEAAAASAGISRALAAVAEARSSLGQLRNQWRAQAATELATAQGELAARRSSLPALQERVDRTSIRSPLAGRINRVLITTRGAAVQPGQPLVEIVPSEDNLLIEARIRPQDIGSVRIGQEARVGITAFDAAVYGRLEGRVVSVSPDAVVDPETRESFYQVMIRTESRGLRDPAGAPLLIGPGMVADVSLRGDDRTILQYILSPITKLGGEAMRE